MANLWKITRNKDNPHKILESLDEEHLFILLDLKKTKQNKVFRKKKKKKNLCRVRGQGWAGVF